MCKRRTPCVKGKALPRIKDTIEYTVHHSKCTVYHIVLFKLDLKVCDKKKNDGCLATNSLPVTFALAQMV